MSVIQLLYVFLAIFGLGFLVFIHELGHYFVALRKGMRVEAFAIGFGKPLITWERNGVKWHFCVLPFGGYVRIAGMQKEGAKEPAEIADGFFGKGPWARIQVALAGPVVNIAFALLVFTALWMTGGRNKPFSEVTHHIGWVDPASPLYAHGVRPGDLIEMYDGKPFTGFKDLQIASIMKEDKAQISGSHIDFATGKKSHFDYTLSTYANPDLPGKERFNTIGVLQPARYLLVDGQKFIAGSPMLGSGVEAGDRILWADGQPLFSQQQLSSLVAEPSAFLTIRREGTILQLKAPRVQLSELKLSLPERGEIDDWQHETGLGGKLQELYFIPYTLSPTLHVEGTLRFIDPEDKKSFSHYASLAEGDQILAVDGTKVATPYDFLLALQKKHVLLIVDRNPSLQAKTLSTQADSELDAFSIEDLNRIVSSIGTNQEIKSAGTLHLLSPIAPKRLSDFAPIEALEGSKQRIQAIADAEKRNEMLSQFEKSKSRPVLGLSLTDREVRYNPAPLAQFGEVFRDTYRTLISLVTGAASPKYVAGPVGIVQIVHHSWTLGVKEALFWIALISLNLGVVNLLPLPILDGGHIVFSLIELVTRRPLKAKTMERLVIPFAALLIGFFIFVTYNDISRLFSAFF